jgi:hypothetical protein
MRQADGGGSADAHLHTCHARSTSRACGGPKHDHTSGEQVSRDRRVRRITGWTLRRLSPVRPVAPCGSSRRARKQFRVISTAWTCRYGGEGILTGDAGCTCPTEQSSAQVELCACGCEKPTCGTGSTYRRSSSPTTDQGQSQEIAESIGSLAGP